MERKQSNKDRIMRITLMDINTGKIVTFESTESVYQWTEGNCNCDCNRSMFFEDHDPDYADDPENILCESKRSYVTDVSGDIDGMSKDDFLFECNQDYPQRIEDVLRVLGRRESKESDGQTGRGGS